MLEKEIIGSTVNDKLTTLHCYNSLGMPNKTITYSMHYNLSCNSGYPSTTLTNSDPLRIYRIKVYEYDASNRYILATRNSMNFRNETITSVNKWLQPITVTAAVSSADSSGVIVNTRYDRFGRQYFSRDNTGKFSQTWQRLYAQASQIGAPNIDESYAYVTKQQAAGVSPSYAYMDALGRTVAKVSTGFDGRYIYQYSRYDTQGRPYQNSVPSFNYSTSNWETTSYDDLNRPKQVISATG